MKSKDFFRYRNAAVSDSYNIAAMIGCVPTKGDIGIEVEVEGNKFLKSNTDKHQIPKQWRYEHDGSLRGYDNAEYVLAKPIPFKEADKAIDDLWKMFEEYGSKLDDSNRTSVHVHLNVQDWHLNRLTAFLALYFSVEEILTEWCGDTRVGNLFCLRGKDATDIVAAFKEFISSNGKVSMPDRMHYSGINGHALMKYGSIEIRTLRGVTTPDPIKTWVGVLQRIYDMSADYKDPRGVIEGFSGQGAIDYLEKVLGPYTNTIIQGAGFDGQRIMESMYEGIRLAQDLCYCYDWDTFKAATVKLDPFGRKMVKAAQAAPAPIGTQFVGINQHQWDTAQSLLAAAPGTPILALADDDDEEDYDYDDEEL